MPEEDDNTSLDTLDKYNAELDKLQSMSNEEYEKTKQNTFGQRSINNIP